MVDDVGAGDLGPAGLGGEHHLRAHAVGGGDEHGPLEPLQHASVEHATEAAHTGEHGRRVRALDGALHAGDGLVAGIDVDPGGAVPALAGLTGDGAPADVAPHLAALERDRGDAVVGALAGIDEVVPEGRDGEHAPAAGDERAVVAHRRAGVEHERVGRYRVESVDQRAGGGRRRVAGCGEDDGDGALLVPGDGHIAERAVHAGESDVDQVGVEKRQQHLRLGVAEAAVELQQARAGGGEHEPGVEHAAIRASLGGHGIDRRLEHGAHELVDELWRAARSRRVGAHAAGVRAAVALAQALVVLGRRHRHQGAPVAEREQRDLFADEPLFEHDAVSGGADGPAEQVRHRAQCRVAPVGDDHALAGGQPVSLGDDGEPGGVEPPRGLGHAGDHGRAGPGDAVSVAERPGVRLRPLQLGGGQRRSERSDAGRRERVDEPCCQRRLRAHDDEPDALVDGEPHDALDIVDGQCHTLPRARRIAGRHHEATAAWRPGDRPRDRMLTPTRPDHQHVEHVHTRARFARLPSSLAPLRFATRPTSRLLTLIAGRLRTRPCRGAGRSRSGSRR